MVHASRRQFTPAQGSTNHASPAGPPNQPNLPEYVDCPSCKSKVLSKKLDRHCRRQHGHPAPPAVNAARPSRHDIPDVWLRPLSTRIVPFPREPPPHLPQPSLPLFKPTAGTELLPQAVSRARATLPGSLPVCPPSTTRIVRTASAHGPLPVRSAPADRAPQTRISSVVRFAPVRATTPHPIVPSLHGEISAQATPTRGVTPVHTGPLAHDGSLGRILVRCDVCKSRLLAKNLEKHKAKIHSRNQKAPTYGQKKAKTKNGTKPKDKAKPVDSEPKRKASTTIQVPSSTSYSEPKTYSICDTCGEKVKGAHLWKHFQVCHTDMVSCPSCPVRLRRGELHAHKHKTHPYSQITKSKRCPSPRLRWTRLPTSKQQLKLPECKRCAHSQLRDPAIRQRHFDTSDCHPCCMCCGLGFRGYRELSEHYQETHSDTWCLPGEESVQSAVETDSVSSINDDE